MPVYTVKDSVSGKVIRITGDSPPTEDELKQIFAKAVLYDQNRKPAATEDYLPQQPQGSPMERALSNLWDVVNPVNIASGLSDLYHDPVTTLKQIALGQAAEGSKALQDAAQGRGSEATGHAAAAMLPIVGPMAAQAGEQIASGDVAGGLGRTAGLVAPALIPEAARLGGRALSVVPDAAASALERGAAARVEDVMAPKVGPKKLRFGNQAAKVAPELLKRGETAAFSRAGLQQNVDAGLSAAQQALDDTSNARLASQQVQTAPILQALDERIARLQATPAEANRVVPTYQGQGGRPTPSGLTRNIDSGRMQPALDPEGRPLGQPVEPAPNRAALSTLRQIRSEVAKLGPVAQYESVRRIREAWDQVAKVKYMPSTAADTLKSQGQATAAMQGTGAIRDALASADPETAKVNADYSVYKAASDVLKATQEIERTRPRVGRHMVARWTGAAVGEQAGGITGAIAGFIGGPMLDSALSAGYTTKLQTARFMQGLADAIRTGDVSAADRIVQQLRRLTRASALGKGTTSPSESRTAPAPSSGLQTIQP